jgi:hypothetical protein
MERIASENIVKLLGETMLYGTSNLRRLHCNMERLKGRERLRRRMNQKDLLQMMKFTMVCPGSIKTRCSCGTMTREKGPMWYVNGNIG